LPAAIWLAATRIDAELACIVVKINFILSDIRFSARSILPT
jgi:hypothetical protein